MITIFKDGVSKQPHYITLPDALKRIKTGRSKSLVTLIRTEPDEERRKLIKIKLPSVLFSGTFKTRNDAGLLKHSGYVILDFDHVKNAHELKKIIFEIPFILAAWISPSGDGVKAIAKIKDGKKHREHYRALLKYFEPYEINPDEKNINESRLCFESWDEDILYKESCETFYETIEGHKYDNIEVKNRETDESIIYAKLKKWAQNKGEIFISGNRNNFLMKMASACNRTGIDKDTAFGFLAADYLHNTDFTVKELQQIIKSVYTNYATQHGIACFENTSIVNKTTNEKLDEKTFDVSLPVQDLIYFSDVAENMKDRIKAGLVKGETSHFPVLDNHFRWLRQELTVIYGYGNHGKSAFCYQLMLIKSIMEGKKWVVFNPENSPADMFYQDIAETHYGMTFNDWGKIDEKKLDESIEFVNEHFFYIFPENDLPTPEYILKRFMETIIKHGIDGVVIDPFNQLSHKNRGRRDDQYLEDQLSDFKRFAQSHNIYFIICAHPHSPKPNQKNTKYDMPTVYDLAGGAMWNHKCDNILCYHRPNYYINPRDSWCQVASQKIKKQKINGTPGVINFYYNRINGRFYESSFEPTMIEEGGIMTSSFSGGYNPLEKTSQPVYRDITIPIKNDDYEF
jgi:twinkle protein